MSFSQSPPPGNLPAGLSIGTHPFATLARDAIAFYLDCAQVLVPVETLFQQFEVLRRPAAVFVTLKRDGTLRGCMGTSEPAQSNAAVEIIENALSAAFRDPRFTPLLNEEFTGLSVSVDILSLPEPIFTTTDLDPSRYGVIVRQGMRQGLLLPGIEEIAGVEEQVAIARQKAGIEQFEPVELFRFEVERYH